MKHHFQPLVQKSAAVEVALVAGQEIDLLRSNAEKLNYKLSELLDEGTVHEDGFVRDAVALHKEVRETVKDLLRFQDQWGAKAEGQQVNQTFNILQVELGKESPETWSRIKNQLMENMGLNNANDGKRFGHSYVPPHESDKIHRLMKTRVVNPASPEYNDEKREEKKRKEEERKERRSKIKHIKIRASQGLGEETRRLDDGNKRDDEREMSLQGGPAGSRGTLLDLATGAKRELEVQ